MGEDYRQQGIASQCYTLLYREFPRQQAQTSRCHYRYEQPCKCPPPRKDGIDYFTIYAFLIGCYKESIIIVEIKINDVF